MTPLPGTTKLPNSAENIVLIVAISKTKTMMLSYSPKTKEIGNVAFYDNNMRNIARGVAVDVLLEGNEFNLVDTTPFMSASKELVLRTVTPRYFQHVIAMKKHVFCEKLQGSYPIFYATLLMSLADWTKPFVAMCNMETGESYIMASEKTFSATYAKFVVEKEEIAENNRDFVGGATFQNGHFIGELDCKKNTTRYGGSSIIAVESITNWLPADDTNPNTIALDALS